MEKISIQDISAILVAKDGLKKKEAEQFVLTMFDIVKEGLLRDKLVKVKGFGTFKIIDVDDRESVNVNTGERVLISGHDKVTFTPDATMKELVNKPFSQFETVVLNEGVTFDDTDTVSGEEETFGEEDGEEVMQEAVETAEAVDTAESVDTAEAVEAVETPSLTPPLEGRGVAAPEETEAEKSGEVDEAEKPEEVDEAEKPGDEEKPEGLKRPKAGVHPLQKTDGDVSPEGAAVEMVLETPVNETPIEPETPVEREDAMEPEYLLEAEDRHGVSMSTCVLAAILACVVGFFGGYLVRDYMGQGSEKAPTDEVAVAADQSEAENALTDTINNEQAKVAAVTDSTANDTAQEDAEKSAQADAEKSVQEGAEKSAQEGAEKSAQADARPAMPDYDQMDVRVRLGAYSIVGVSYTEKVRPGDTMARIAKRTLGPDMECYIEVLNGIKPGTPLQEGQTIKIPELVLKKKLRKAKNG